MAHGAQYFCQMCEGELLLLKVAGVEKAYQRSGVGQAGGKGCADAGVADETGRFHEELDLSLNEGLDVVVAQRRSRDGQNPFEDQHLRGSDDEGGSLHDGRDDEQAGADLVDEGTQCGMFGRQRTHAGAAAVRGFKNAASGKGAYGGPQGGAVDVQLVGELTFGGQAFKQLPAAFHEVLLQLLFNHFLLAHA